MPSYSYNFCSYNWSYHLSAIKTPLQKKIEVIILPASFTEQTGKVHWETLVKARAIENLSYVVTSCQGGYHINGKKTYGHTMIVSPWGKTLETLEKGKGFVSSEIDLIQLKVKDKNILDIDVGKRLTISAA